MPKEKTGINQTKARVIAKLEDLLKERQTYGIEIDYISISEESDLLSDLELDSLEIMNFIVEMERIFDICFTDPYELVENAGTVGELVKYIEQLKDGD